LGNEEIPRAELIGLATNIVCAYVGNNPVAQADISGVIIDVFDKLANVGVPVEPEIVLTPAVSVKKSVGNDFIICLDCGKKQKMLKRHIQAAHGLTPEEYRTRWQLGYDYPMISPSYAVKRQEIAKQIGLGRKPANPAPKRSRKKA
jgi:predicted transcriptional regulator